MVGQYCGTKRVLFLSNLTTFRATFLPTFGPCSRVVFWGQKQNHQSHAVHASPPASLASIFPPHSGHGSRSVRSSSSMFGASGAKYTAVPGSSPWPVGPRPDRHEHSDLVHSIPAYLYFVRTLAVHSGHGSGWPFVGSLGNGQSSITFSIMSSSPRAVIARAYSHQSIYHGVTTFPTNDTTKTASCTPTRTMTSVAIPLANPTGPSSGTSAHARFIRLSTFT